MHNKVCFSTLKNKQSYEIVSYLRRTLEKSALILCNGLIYAGCISKEIEVDHQRSGFSEFIQICVLFSGQQRRASYKCWKIVFLCLVGNPGEKFRGTTINCNKCTEQSKILDKFSSTFRWIKYNQKRRQEKSFSSAIENAIVKCCDVPTRRSTL